MENCAGTACKLKMDCAHYRATTLSRWLTPLYDAEDGTCIKFVPFAGFPPELREKPGTHHTVGDARAAHDNPETRHNQKG